MKALDGYTDIVKSSTKIEESAEVGKKVLLSDMTEPVDGPAYLKALDGYTSVVKSSKIVVGPTDLQKEEVLSDVADTVDGPDYLTALDGYTSVVKGSIKLAEPADSRTKEIPYDGEDTVDAPDYLQALDGYTSVVKSSMNLADPAVVTESKNSSYISSLAVGRREIQAATTEVVKPIETSTTEEVRSSDYLTSLVSQKLHGGETAGVVETTTTPAPAVGNPAEAKNSSGYLESLVGRGEDMDATSGSRGYLKSL